MKSINEICQKIKKKYIKPKIERVAIYSDAPAIGSFGSKNSDIIER